jgi:hypothetical protein
LKDIKDILKPEEWKVYKINTIWSKRVKDTKMCS